MKKAFDLVPITTALIMQLTNDIRFGLVVYVSWYIKSYYYKPWWYHRVMWFLWVYQLVLHALIIPRHCICHHMPWSVTFILWDIFYFTKNVLITRNFCTKKIQFAISRCNTLYFFSHVGHLSIKMNITLSVILYIWHLALMNSLSRKLFLLQLSKQRKMKMLAL
jgi:hypothetical protein